VNGLRGARIAVTGAAGGIGAAACAWLVAAGAEVYALDLSPADEQAGTFVRTDVTDPASVTAAVESITATAGAVDGLVAGAGIAENDIAAEEMPIETFDRVLSVNLRGVFLCCQAFGRRMLDVGHGRIVVISSMSGTTPSTCHSANAPTTPRRPGLVPWCGRWRWSGVRAVSG